MIGVRMSCNNIIKLFNALRLDVTHNGLAVLFLAGVNENTAFFRLKKQ